MKTKNLLIVGTFVLALILGVLLAAVAVGATIYLRPDLITNLVHQIHPMALPSCQACMNNAKECLNTCKECLINHIECMNACKECLLP